MTQKPVVNEFKVIVVGDAGSGKTCMLACINGDPIPRTYVQTQGVKRSTYDTTFQNQKVSLKLWDLTGADNFRTFTSGCYSNAKAAILTYRMNDAESLMNVTSWYENIKNVLTEISKHERVTFENMHFTVVGLQNDTKRPAVTIDQGEGVANNLGCPHFSGSCKDPRDFQEMIHSIVGRLMEQAQRENKDRNIERQRHLRKGTDEEGQPLLGKEPESPKTICDCGCRCTLL